MLEPLLGRLAGVDRTGVPEAAALVEAILQGRKPIALTATRLTQLDLPLDWSEKHQVLAS